MENLVVIGVNQVCGLWQLALPRSARLLWSVVPTVCPPLIPQSGWGVTAIPMAMHLGCACARSRFFSVLEHGEIGVRVLDGNPRK